MAYTSPFDIPDDDPEFQAFKTQFLGTGKEQNSGLAGDLGTGLKIGVEQLPGVVTGLADIALSPVSKMTGVNRPVSRAADWLGEQTGFQPANWAKQVEQGYSPQYQEAKQNVHDAEGFLPTVGALVRNPRFIAGTVAESLPSMVAGMGIAGVGARAVIGAEKLAALRAAAAAGDGAALTQLGRAGALAGGVGEGVVTAGQQMSQTGYDVDPLLAAGTATAAGIGTGAIGAVSGRLAAKMGISDVDSLAVTGLANRGVTSGAKGIAKNMAKGVFTEGVLEELPQSMQEQIWQNVANGKPWDEGVSEQGAIGMMAGAVMGAGANIAPRSSPKPKSEPVADDKEPVNLLSPDAPKGTQGDLFGEGGTQGPLMTPGYNDAPADGNPIRDRVVEMMSDRATLDAFVKENYTTNPDAAAQAIALIDRIDNGLRSITQGAPATDTYANFNPNQGSLDLGFAPDTAQEPVNLLAPESTQAPVQDDLVSRWEAALNETQSTQVAQESGQGASGVAGGSTGNTQTQPGVGRGGDSVAATPVLSSGANQLVGNTTGPDGAGVAGSFGFQNPHTQSLNGIGPEHTPNSLRPDSKKFAEVGDSSPSGNHLFNSVNADATPLPKQIHSVSGETISDKVPRNSVGVNIQKIRDLLSGATVNNKRLNVLDSDLFGVVQRLMFAAGKDAQVRGAIIQSIPVDVMNMFRREKISAEQLFNNPSVLKSVFFGGKPYNSVPLVVNPASAILEALTRPSTEKLLGSSQLVRSAFDGLSAAATVNGGHVAPRNVSKLSNKSSTNVPATQGVKPGTQQALEAEIVNLMPEDSPARQDHIETIQAAKSYTAARKALAKMSPEGLKVALRFASARDQRIVAMAIGFDDQGNSTGAKLPTLDDVAKANGLKNRQRVQQILKSYGIDADVINRMNAADQQAVSVSELMPSQQEDGGAQDGTGFRIMDTPNASDDFDVKDLNSPWHVLKQAEQARLRGDKTVPSNEEIIKTLREAKKPVQDTNDNVQTAEESPEVVRNRQEAARKSEMAMVEEARAIAGDLAEEAMSTWNEIAESASPQGPAFHTISPKDQVAWLLEYNEFIGEHGDEKFEEYWPKLVKLYDEYTSVTQVNNESGQIETARTAGFSSVESNDTGATRSVERLGVQSESNGEQTQDASRAEQASSAEGSADGVKQSRGVEGSTQAATIESKLKPLFFSSSRFSNRVVVVQSAAALPQNLQSSIDGNTQAFVQGGKVYMIADNIAEGKELAVFLHEVGVHLGMKGLIGQENLNRLAMQIKRWAVKNDGSVESELAKKALSRVKSAQQGGVDMELGDVIEERVAYFVEEAVNAGINPTALGKSGGPLQQWFRTLWAAVKVALRKFGLDRVHTLTAQNVVDLSYGAARLELEGTWHGTAADFRNFNHDYMGSGEGAQAFGWGTYLAQRPGIAKGYWKDDVARKHDRGDVVFPDGRRVNQTSIINDGADAPQLLAYDYLENAGGGDYAKAIEFVRDTGFKFREDAAKILESWRDAGAKFERATDKGSLMRVDTAVHEDEMLDWDKPLSEQNKVRIALMPLRKFLAHTADELSGGANWNDLTGEEMYRLVQRALQQDYFDPNLPGVDEALRQGKTDKAASEYLDSIGIKGIKFLDSQSRGTPGNTFSVGGVTITATLDAASFRPIISALTSVGVDPAVAEEAFELLSASRNTSDPLGDAKFGAEGAVLDALNKIKPEQPNQTRNLVIFNDKNIQRVVTQVGADRERIKFSKSSNIAQTNPQYRKTSTLARQTLEYLGNKFQSVENNTMFGHQLAQKAEQLMPGTSRYFKSLIQRQTERVKHEQEIARIANRYNELETRDQNALNAFVQKSTMDGKWGFKPTWFEKDVQTPVDQTMKAEFDKLTPEAQQIAKDMFKFGSEQQKRFDASVNASITDPKKKVPRNQMYGKPYAPLKRFGDHVVVGKSTEFVAEEKAHPGSKRLEEMKADENHYYVEFTDGNWESIKRRDEMAATNPNMTWDSKPLQLENRALNSVNMTILEKLKNQIEASDNKSADATKGALKSLANQLYIQQLNQMHANKSQAKRLKVKGAEADMMKAFVSQGRAEAALIANLMTHAESEAGLQQIQTAARTGDNQDAKTRVANAVLRRHLAMLDFQPTPIQNKLMGANSFMMLLTSPAYYLTNATQPFVVSMPYMAGRFGGANSWNTLRDAYKTTLELVKLSTLFKDQNLDAAHLKKFNSVGREAEALQVLLDENLVNVGMEMELGDIASQSKNPAMKNLQKGLQVLKTGVANVEVLNRLSTAVAAYRLAYAEALNKGSSKDAAHEAGTSYARQTIIDTHGDYAGYNAPTVMMQGAFGSMPVKLMTQFKKFQFIQAGLLIGTFRDAYLRGNLNENEKAAAKAMFKWMLGTQAALAGALGGVTGVPMALLGALVAGVFGDDGEDKETFLRRILGGGAFAQLILHGAPAAAGVDISKRVGMGAALDPFRMADPQTDWSDYALSLAGPSAGLASRTASGLNYIGKGQYWKGLEMLMPSGVLTNASKIARYEAEGLTNSRGDVVMKPEEISLMTDLMQGLGLETTQLSDRRWKAGAIYDRGIHFKEKTSQLQRQYVDAFKDGDREELTAIRQEWMKLQAERVNQGFKRENMTALTQAPMAQKKRERETVNGLQTTQTNKQFVASMDTL